MGCACVFVSAVVEDKSSSPGGLRAGPGEAAEAGWEGAAPGEQCSVLAPVPAPPHLLRLPGGPSRPWACVGGGGRGACTLVPPSAAYVVFREAELSVISHIGQQGTRG